MKEFAKLFDFEDKTQLLLTLKPSSKTTVIEVTTTTVRGSTKLRLQHRSKEAAADYFNNYSVKDAVKSKAIINKFKN
jgi:hypothetical protein